MTTTYAKVCKSPLIPSLRYRNAKTMIDWLCRAFGFAKNAVYLGPNDVVMHAQLTFGNGMIMLGSVDNDSPASKFFKQPDEIGGAETQSSYLIVSDIDALYASAKSAGATIVMDLERKITAAKVSPAPIRKAISGASALTTPGNPSNPNQSPVGAALRRLFISDFFFFAFPSPCCSMILRRSGHWLKFLDQKHQLHSHQNHPAQRRKTIQKRLKQGLSFQQAECLRLRMYPKTINSSPNPAAPA